MGSLSPKSMIQTAKSLPLLRAAYIILSWPGPPHTPGRKKLAAKDEASFVKSKRGSGPPPRLRCIAADAVACHEAVLSLGATSGGAVKLLHRLDRQVVVLDFN
jgi:hypothetical protein